jgi:hypothetical protein
MGFTNNFIVDWGDGIIESNKYTHTYTNAGTYIVYMFGTIEHLQLDTKLTRILEIGNVGWKSFTGFCFTCINLVSIKTIDPSYSKNVMYCDYAWGNCKILTSFPRLDLSSSKTFTGAWNNCSKLTSFPGLDLSKGTNFSFAWDNCIKLTSFPGKDDGLDLSKGTYFSYAWNNCTELESFPGLDLSKGEYFDNAWCNCTALQTIGEDIILDTEASRLDAFDGVNMLDSVSKAIINSFWTEWFPP